MESFDQNKIGSIITLESGHAIDSSLALLRMFYDLGVRGMTLTWQCSTPWADYDGETRNPNPPHNGLTDFGKLVVREMNRLGMIVDLSHVSDKVMHDTLDISEAPLHFSHSGAYAICNTTRNVKDDVLLRMKEKDGILMIPFIDDFIGCRSNTDSDKVQLSEVADHFDYVRNLIGADYLGIGSGFDCCTRDLFAEGLEDASTYPNLFAELLRRGWTEEELRKIAGLNLIRVWKQVEVVRDRLAAAGMAPIETLIPAADTAGEICRTWVD
ncbi:dipeptidase 1-like [Branchiostoma floridae x Branchiostoma belcheri]